MVRRPKFKAVVLSVVLLLDALFILFPDWEAVHPNYPSLTMDAGHAWLRSPPPPPAQFNTMHVRKGHFWIWAVILTTTMGAVALAIGEI